MDTSSKIFIAGANGMVGSAIVRLLKQKGYQNLLTPNSKNVDLRNQKQVADFFEENKPEYVFLAAAKVGGIHANNNYPADFIYDNMMIQNNVIHQSYINDVKKLLFLGSSCIYPKYAEQPISEKSLLTGTLEPTNEAYAIAKISGLKMCEFYKKQYGCHFISAMPTNLYGTNDNFNLQNSHVLPALLRKFIESKNNHQKEVIVWGTGQPMREFLYVDDLAEALLFLMHNYNDYETVNVGTGQDITIKELAESIKKMVGYEGQLVFDTTKPDGTPRKLLNVSKINEMGWQAKTSLNEGLSKTLSWLEANDFKAFT